MPLYNSITLIIAPAKVLFGLGCGTIGVLLIAGEIGGVFLFSAQGKRITA